MLGRHTRQSAFSLVELMVALATGLFLLAGVVGIFSMSLHTNSTNLKMTRLNQDLRSAVDLMQRELRRAGYWHLANYAASPAGNALPSAVSGAITLDSVEDDGATAVDSFSQFGAGAVGLQIIADGAAATITNYSGASQVSASVTDSLASTDMIREGAWMIVNPFSASTNDVTISGSCITYTYDQDDPVTNPGAGTAAKSGVGDHERFGFRLANGAVEMYRYSSAALSCAAAAESDDWYPVTSSNITITALSFSDTNFTCVNLTDNSTNCNPSAAGYTAPDSGDILLWIREIDVTLTGHLATDSSISRTLTESIRLRNDKLAIN